MFFIFFLGFTLIRYRLYSLNCYPILKDLSYEIDETKSQINIIEFKLKPINASVKSLISKRYSNGLKILINKVIDNHKILQKEYISSKKNIIKILTSSEKSLSYYRFEGLIPYYISTTKYTSGFVPVILFESYENKLLHKNYFNELPNCKYYSMFSNLDFFELNNNFNLSINYILCSVNTFEEYFSTWTLNLDPTIETVKKLMQSLTIEDNIEKWNENKKEKLNLEYTESPKKIEKNSYLLF